MTYFCVIFVVQLINVAQLLNIALFFVIAALLYPTADSDPFKNIFRKNIMEYFIFRFVS